MNRKQTSATPAESTPLTPGKLPLEAEVRANDLELDESTTPEEARDTADDEAQPGKGENVSSSNSISRTSREKASHAASAPSGHKKHS